MLFYKTSFVNGKINPRIKLTDNFLLADEHNNEEKIIFNNYGDFTYQKITQSTGALEDDKSKQELVSFFEAISITDESVDIPALPDLYSSNFGYYDSELNPWGHSFVSTIRDQGDCGTCWAFGLNFQLQVLSSLQYYFNTGKPKNIHTSTQNSVNYLDNDKNIPYNKVCDSGGTVKNLISVTKDSGVISSEKCRYVCDSGMTTQCRNAIENNLCEEYTPIAHNKNSVVNFLPYIIGIVFIGIIIWYFVSQKKKE